VHGSAGWGVVQSHGAQAAPAGHAGQAHTAGVVVEPEAPPVPADTPPAPGLFWTGIVVVIVVIGPQAQLQAGQA
jgi:hypothetical protein